MKLKKKKITGHDYDKYITTLKFNKLTTENFATRLASLTSKSDTPNFVKKTDFDEPLKNVTSKKNELNELSKKVKVISKNIKAKKVKAISTKGFTKDLINKFSVLNGAKYFSSGLF